MVEHVAGRRRAGEFRLIGGGHSNLTYAARGRRRSVVVRRPPLGSRGGNAHDMGREHRVISALVATVVPVPGALALCTDESVNGGSFYVMTHVDGTVVDNVRGRRRSTYGARRSAIAPASRSSMCWPSSTASTSTRSVSVMRPDGTASSTASCGGSTACGSRRRPASSRSMSTLADRLVELAPPQRYTGIVHSDYRFGNVMVDPDGHAGRRARLGAVDARRRAGRRRLPPEQLVRAGRHHPAGVDGGAADASRAASAPATRWSSGT